MLGIATSFLSLANLITYLIENQPVYVWSFFFGLILASIVFVGRNVRWNWKTMITGLVFVLLAFFITSPENAPLNQNNALWYIFLCGAIAICAMILPGISGSFILVLLGQYFYIMNALTELNIIVLSVFISGALIGIVSFANVLSWLFKHYEMITLSALTGFMAGSLNKIWPWKNTIETYIDKHGKIMPLIQENILPNNFDMSFIWACLLILLGFTIVFVLEMVANKLKKQ